MKKTERKTMDYVTYLEKSGRIYAGFHGTMSGIVSEVSHTCMKINHGGNYRGMYNQLREEIQAEIEKLTKKLETLQ